MTDIQIVAWSLIIDDEIQGAFRNQDMSVYEKCEPQQAYSNGIVTGLAIAKSWLMLVNSDGDLYRDRIADAIQRATEMDLLSP